MKLILLQVIIYFFHFRNYCKGETLIRRIIENYDDSDQHSALNARDPTLNDDTVWRSTDLEFGYYFAGENDEMLVGLRFTDIQIDAGSIIQGAYIELVGDETDSSSLKLRLYGELNTSPNRYDNIDNKIRPRVTTTMSVLWEPPAFSKDNIYYTSDLKDVVQELIDQDGYYKGNPMNFIFKLDSSNVGFGRRAAVAYDGDPNKAAKLVIDYIPAPEIPPTSSPTFIVPSSNGLREYTYHDDLVNYNTAKSICASYDQALASIWSKEDNEAIQNATGKASILTWIGLNDIQNEDQFRFEGFEFVSLSRYTNFHPNEPNNGILEEEDCVAIVGSTGLWYDINCNDLAPFVCVNKPKCNVNMYYDTNSSECRSCEIGYTCPGTDDIFPCSTGNYCDPSKSLGEIPCPAGTYNDVEASFNSTSCIPCAAGTYSEYGGTSACTPCPINTFSEEINANSSEVCRSCALIAGFTEITGATSCKIAENGICPPTQYSYNITECDENSNSRTIIYYSNLTSCKVDESSTTIAQCSYIPFSSQDALLVYEIIGVAIFLNGVVLLMTIFYRKNKVIRASQMIPSVSYIISAMLVSASLLLYLGEASEFSCPLRIYTGMTSFTLFLSIIFTKIRHIYLIFTNKTMRKYNQKQALYTVILCISINIILLCIWTIIEPPTIGFQESLITIDKRYCNGLACLSPKEQICINTISSPFFFIYGALISLLVLYCCYISFKARNLPTTLSEAKLNMLLIYNIAFVVSILILIKLFFEFTYIQSILLYSFGILWISITSVYIIFIPKFILIFSKTEQQLKFYMDEKLTDYFNNSSTFSSSIQATSVSFGTDSHYVASCEGSA